MLNDITVTNSKLAGEMGLTTAQAAETQARAGLAGAQAGEVASATELAQAKAPGEMELTQAQADEARQRALGQQATTTQTKQATQIAAAPQVKGTPGTTDQPYHADPAQVQASDDDQRQILAEAAQSLEPGLLDPGRVRSRFAGLRVLPVAGSSTARTRRETVIGRVPHGMVSVAGGKLTTWRAIGQRAAAMALESLGRTLPVAGRGPLPGAGDPAVREAAETLAVLLSIFAPYTA